MNKLYNTQRDISTNLSDFIKNSVSNITKTQLNILPSIIFGMIKSESCVTIDIAKNLKDNFCDVLLPSTQRRIRRFFNNKFFDGHDFYCKIIAYVIENYKCKHPDNRVHIAMDHMFVRDMFTIFMLSLRIGKQSIPLWFECFNGKNDPNAFKTDTLIKGIDFVNSLFKNKNYHLIFLGDRFFNSTKLMQHIESIGHYYVFRLKDNYKCLVYDNHEKYYIWKHIKDLNHYQFKTATYNNIYFTRNEIKTNIVISPKNPKSLINSGIHNDIIPWFLITNSNTKFAIKDYSYRFGAIEFLFKSQKSNGFFLEKTTTSNLHAFTNMFACVCFSILWLTILGVNYSKNPKQYKNIKIDCVRKYVNGPRRIMSLFKTGLTLFNIAFNSIHNIKLPYNFKLYDY
ncbi:MAG: hypothetical protein Q4G04_06945 [bacterium]|nr:hypothetical protein [bacterium]